MKVSAPYTPGNEPQTSVGLDGNPVPSRVESVKKFLMKTNANPTVYNQDGTVPQELPNSINNVETKVPEATEPISPQLALLAKQRRALQVRQRELETREKALREKESGSPSIDVAQLKAEPLRILLENGVTYQQLADAVMASQNSGNPEVYALKAEIAALKQGIDQRFTEEKTTQEKQILAEMQREASSLVEANENFELIKATRSVPQVMRLIERTYRETGEVLDISEACRLVEDELFKDAQKIVQAKKLQGQLPQALQPQPRSQPVMRTLTNRDTASPVLSAKQRAIAAFYGQLKK